VRAVQTARGFNDFLSPYIQSQAWVRGLDPYSPRTLLQLWPAGASHFLFLPREVADGTLVARRGIPTAYPLTALVLLSPFSLLPWNLAYGLWLALNLALVAALIFALLRLSGFSFADPRAILLMAAVLALAPIHTGIATGNITLLAVGLSVVGICAAQQAHDLAAGALIAVSVALKPQIGIWFLLFYFLRRRWRVPLFALLLLAGLMALGWSRTAIAHIAWFGDYLNDNRILLETGVLGNFTAINPTRFGLVNLQVALYPILGSVRLTNTIAEALGSILLLVWLPLVWKRRAVPDFELRDSDLLHLSAIAVLGMLPIYHRFYDAALLVLPLCWALRALVNNRRAAISSLLLMLPFAVPGGSLLQTMEEGGRISSTLASLWWWQTIVMAHQAWLLLLLAMVLLYQMSLDAATKTKNLSIS
jgi:hypothetical protein